MVTEAHPVDCYSPFSRFSFALKSPFAENSSAVLSPPTVRFENHLATTLLFHRFYFFVFYHACGDLSIVFCKKIGFFYDS